MQAIGHVIVAGNENRVLFCSGEEFTNDLVEAIRLKSTEKVRSKYRKLKLLMIDDVQFIAGKATIQEEFFHTFNTIQKEGGQIIMTSDRPPAEITKLEDRLKSRFGAGLIVDVGQPDFELRTAILLIKSKQLGVNLEMDLAQLIASQIEGVRELQGFLVKIMSEKEGAGKEINRENLEKLLNVSRGQNGHNKVVTPSEVMTLVGDYYRVTTQQLKGERRTKMVAWPRQILMYLLRNELRLPLEEVGRLVGGRDHSTVMHADSKVKVEMEVNPKIAAEIQDIKKRILL
jgi:chromosomal replication initiator protein